MMAFSFLFFAIVFIIVGLVKNSGGIKEALKKIKVWQYIAGGVFLAVCVTVAPADSTVKAVIFAVIGKLDQSADVDIFSIDAVTCVPRTLF